MQNWKSSKFCKDIVGKKSYCVLNIALQTVQILRFKKCEICDSIKKSYLFGTTDQNFWQFV